MKHQTLTPDRADAQLPTRDEQIELNRRRWSEVLADSSLADLPYRIETNAYGELVMNLRRPAATAVDKDD